MKSRLEALIPVYVLPSLAVLRMVALFAPIIITWWGVHDAASAYQAELSRNPDAEAQSFFRGWLDGFDGAAVFTFEQMAFWVFTCVGALVLLSIANEILKTKYSVEAVSDEAKLLIELKESLDEVVKQLDRERNLTAEELTTGLAENADTVTRLTSALHGAADNARDVIVKMQESVDAIEKTTSGALDTARQAAQTISSASGNAATAIGDASKQLSGGADQLTKVVTEYSDRSAETLAEFNGLITQLGDALADDRSNFANRLSDLLPDLLNQMDRSHVKALKEYRDDLPQLMQPLAQQLASAQADALKGHTHELTQAMNRLADSHDRYAQTLATWAPTLAGHQPRRGLLGRLRR